jgi:hypothetical protein
MDDIVRWNDLVVSAKSCSMAVQLVPYSGIVQLDYADKLDAELVHDMQRSGVPVGTTSGEYSVDGFKYSVLKDVWIVKMQPQLIALGLIAGGTGYGAARFTFTAQWQEGPLVGTDTISGCRIVGTHDSIQQGTAKAIVEVTLLAKTLLRNGVGLMDLTRLP